jgi:hypothetical protein
MANQLSPQLLAQLFAQESNDPFLTLLTLTHPNFAAPLRFVNDNQNITSRGETFLAFPFRLRLPVDDAEQIRNVSIEFDNVSLELVDEIRSVTTAIQVKMEMVLASLPNVVQMSLEELEIQNISYDKFKISATLVIENFLNTEMTSERYNPSNFPGLF